MGAPDAVERGEIGLVELGIEQAAPMRLLRGASVIDARLIDEEGGRGGIGQRPRIEPLEHLAELGPEQATGRLQKLEITARQAELVKFFLRHGARSAVSARIAIGGKSFQIPNGGARIAGEFLTSTAITGISHALEALQPFLWWRGNTPMLASS